MPKIYIRPSLEVAKEITAPTEVTESGRLDQVRASLSQKDAAVDGIIDRLRGDLASLHELNIQRTSPNSSLIELSWQPVSNDAADATVQFLEGRGDIVVVDKADHVTKVARNQVRESKRQMQLFPRTSGSVVEPVPEPPPEVTPVSVEQASAVVDDMRARFEARFKAANPDQA